MFICEKSDNVVVKPPVSQGTAMAASLVHDHLNMRDALGSLFDQVRWVVAIAVAADQQGRRGNLAEPTPKIKGVFGHEQGYHAGRVLDTRQGSYKPQQSSKEPLSGTRCRDACLRRA